MASTAASQEHPKAMGSGDLEAFGGCLRGQPAPLYPLLPHISCGYPPLPCYSLLQPPQLGFLAPQASSAPCQLPRAAPMLWPAAPLLYSPLLQPGGVVPEDPSRPKSAASRESTAALKAWLDRHLKNPYPSKGEKVLLAVVSRMSLTQVSTWFANARRRLKKESRASWAPQGPKPRGDQEEEVEEEEEEEESGGGEAQGGRPEPGTPRPNKKSPLAPQVGSGVATAPWQKVEQTQNCLGPLPASKAKIWRVAELATDAPPGKDAD